MKRRTLWLTIAICALFVLAHDFWAWREPIPLGPFGLPRWIYVFVMLQFGLSAVISWYSRHDRRANDDSISEGDDA